MVKRATRPLALGMHLSRCLSALYDRQLAFYIGGTAAVAKQYISVPPLLACMFCVHVMLHELFRLFVHLLNRNGHSATRDVPLD